MAHRVGVRLRMMRSQDYLCGRDLRIEHAGPVRALPVGSVLRWQLFSD